MKIKEFLFRDLNIDSLSFHPWPTFLSFLFANTVLAYTMWPLQTKLIIGVLFIGLPTLLAWNSLRKADPSEDTEPIGLPNPPALLYWIFAAGLLFTQFYHLDQNPFWPSMDDSRVDYFTLNLSRHWDWKLLYGEAQFPPLCFWLIAPLCRFIAPTPTLFQTIPAVLFVLTTCVLYWTARRFFPRGLSFVIFLFFAFSFAPYSISRFHQGLIFSLLLECLLFGLLGVYFRDKPRDLPTWVLLSLVLSAGLYTYIGFGAVALWATTLLFFVAFRKKRWTPALWVGVVSLLLVGPLLMAYLSPHGTDYYRSNFEPSHFGIPFLIGFFWFGFDSAPNGPNWGGWYNSMTASLIFLGLLSMYRDRKKTMGSGYVLRPFRFFSSRRSSPTMCKCFASHTCSLY
jgi:hypothetical protein